MTATANELWDHVMDTTAAAAILGLSRATVTEFLNTGRLPGTRWGQRWLIRRTDVERLARTRPVAPTPATGLQLVARRRELDALVQIAQQPGMTVKDLMELSGEPRRSALARLQVLDREGLIRREAHRPTEPHQCYLTDAGWAVYRREFPQDQSASRLSVMTEEEAGTT